MYNDKAVATLIDCLIQDGVCPSEYDLKEKLPNGECTACFMCWQQALQQPPEGEQGERK